MRSDCINIGTTVDQQLHKTVIIIALTHGDHQRRSTVASISNEVHIGTAIQQELDGLYILDLCCNV